MISKQVQRWDASEPDAAHNPCCDVRNQEESLLKTGALQNAILTSANFSSIATDEKGVIQLFNVGAERMLGYAADEVLNKITPADISDPQEVIARAKALSVELGATIQPGFEALAFKASRGIEDIYELTYIRKDGTRFPAVVSVTALRDDEGAIIGYLLIGADNTARKLAEEKLRWTEESFRLMVESVSDCAIVMLDPEGHVASWNTGAQRIKGYSAEEIVGKHFSLFYQRADVERGQPQQELAAAEKGQFENEGWRVRKDGSTFWANVVFTPIRDPLGNLRGFAKLTRDLTHRMKVEAVLNEAKSAAEQANEAKSNFLARMSHELRSPLNAILGFAQLMESDTPPPTPSQMESIAQILHAGRHLLALINEILDLSRIESGQEALSQEPVSMTEALLECQGMIEPQARRRGITVRFPKLSEPCYVSADLTRVKQVFINLLSNAIKYNRPNGTVEVECLRLPGRLRVSLRDTGAGLPPDKVAQLFQPFNRLGQEAGGEEGTGIGLVVAKRLVELMGGTIGVQSTVGLGSVFWFELLESDLPHVHSDPDISTSMEKVPLTPSEGRRTVLYIEDNPANLALVEQIMRRREDIHLLSAVNGYEGVARAREVEPDLILLDINLPDISGIEVLGLLRKDSKTHPIPVVALSANALPSDIEKALAAGFFRYLTKPIHVRDFLDTLDLALSSSKARTRLCDATEERS